MDILVVVLVVAVVGAVIFFLATAGRRPQAQGGEDVWAQVSAIIGGTRHRAKLIGSYEGRPVEVFIQDEGYEMTSYRYYLIMKVPMRGYDWTIDYGEFSFLNPTKSWHIKSGDEAIRQRLREAGAVELVEQDRWRPKVRYRADRGTLEYARFVVEADSVPAPDEFKAQLDLLARLADMNEELNVW